VVRGTLQLRSKPGSPAEVHAALEDYLRRRPDVGLDKLLLGLALDPASPFNPQGRRRLRKGFVLLMLVATGITATFVYFNFF
jgi:hypothetical protein